MCSGNCTRRRAALHHTPTTLILDPTISVQRPRATGHVGALALSSARTGEGCARQGTSLGRFPPSHPCRLCCRRRSKLSSGEPEGRAIKSLTAKVKFFFEAASRPPHEGRVTPPPREGRSLQGFPRHLRGGVSRAPHTFATPMVRPRGESSHPLWWTRRSRLANGGRRRATRRSKRRGASQ